MRVPEVAERLNVPKSYAYALIGEGRLPALQLRGRGSSVRVDENGGIGCERCAEPEPGLTRWAKMAKYSARIWAALRGKT